VEQGVQHQRADGEQATSTRDLDAIEYGYKIEQQRANNINITSQLGSCFRQAGNSAEKDYYIDRVRRERSDVKVTVPAERRRSWRDLYQGGVEPARAT